jgi:diguanylate cyclase (GGDEF)-like protein
MKRKKKKAKSRTAKFRTSWNKRAASFLTMRAFLLLVCLAIASPWAVAATEASTQVEALLQQAEHVRSSDPAEFRRLMTSLHAAKGQATSEQIQHIGYLDAYDAVFAGRYQEGLRQAEELERSATDVDTRFRAGALIVNAYAITGRFEEGLRQLGHTMALIDRIQDAELRQHGMIVAATLYNQIGQYKLGLQYADRILSEKAPARTRCFAGQYRLEALQNLKALPADDASIVDVIDDCMAQHEVVVANFLRTTLARKWADEGSRPQALEMLQEHLAQAEATRYPRVIAEVNALMAELLFDEGNIAEAERHALEVTALRDSIANTQPLVTAYKVLYQIAEVRHDPTQALAFYKGYAQADKAYLNVIKARELAYQIVRQESLEKNQQIELLNRRNSLLQLQQRVEQQKAENSRLLMLFLAILTLLVALWAYRTKRVQVSMRRMAETDALTGICNRHHFTALAEQTLAQCGRGGKPAALIMLDLDHFKSINDTYGHVTGDWVLKQVASVGKALCRPVDHFGRIGGEEFAILLDGCDLKAATRVAEDFRVRIARIQSAGSGFNFRITASFGVTCSMMAAYDLDKLLSQADQMLYRAKHAGRDRVMAFAHELPMELRGALPQADFAVAPGSGAAVPLSTSKA